MSRLRSGKYLGILVWILLCVRRVLSLGVNLKLAVKSTLVVLNRARYGFLISILISTTTQLLFILSMV